MEPSCHTSGGPCIQNVRWERDSLLSCLSHCHSGCLFLTMETIPNQPRGLGWAWMCLVVSTMPGRMRLVGDGEESLSHGWSGEAVSEKQKWQVRSQPGWAEVAGWTVARRRSGDCSQCPDYFQRSPGFPNGIILWRPDPLGRSGSSGTGDVESGLRLQDPGSHLKLV